MKETEKINAVYVLKRANAVTNMLGKVDYKSILKMLGVGGASAGVGYGVGHGTGKAKGYNEGAQVGQDSAMRNLLMGIYSTLTDTANKGKGVSIPGLELGVGVKHIAPKNPVKSAPAPAPAPAPAVKASSHRELFEKAAFLGSLAGATGRGITKGIGWGAKRLGKHVDDASMQKALGSSGLMKTIGGTALGAGGLGLGVGTATGWTGGSQYGHNVGWDKGIQRGFGAGYGAGGNQALQNAGQQLGQTYGGIGGRFRALTGGAQPGQDAIAQLMQQYQMPQQGFNESPGFGFMDNFMNPFGGGHLGAGGGMNQYGQPFNPMQMNLNQRRVN